MASNSAFVEFFLTNFGRVLTKLAQDIYSESIGPGFFFCIDWLQDVGLVFS